MASGRQDIELQGMNKHLDNDSSDNSDSEADDRDPTSRYPEAVPMLPGYDNKPVPPPRQQSNPNLLSKSQKSLQSLGNDDKPDVKPKPKPRNQSKSSIIDEKPPLPDVNEPFINPVDYSDERDNTFADVPLPNQLKTGEIDQQPAPTGLLAWVGFGLSLLALACCCVSFASPYWMQAYPMSFNSFSNMGLWEVCMKEYMHHKDDTQTIYSGCWWVFNGDEKYSKLREWLLPPWFITCQVMMSMDLICHFAVVGIIITIFLHFCPLVNHEYHQSYAMFAASGLCFFITILTFLIGIMYGLFCGDRNWMPRPDLNFISWGYGFLIIQGIVSSGAGVCLFLEAQKAFNELDRRDQEYTRAVLDMEMSQGYPMDTSYVAPSHTGSTYATSPADYNTDKKSYASQPSYDPFPHSVSGTAFEPYPQSSSQYPPTSSEQYYDKPAPPYPGYS